MLNIYTSFIENLHVYNIYLKCCLELFALKSGIDEIKYIYIIFKLYGLLAHKEIPLLSLPFVIETKLILYDKSIIFPCQGNTSW